ncbi:hypothetical protein ACLMJK_007352 [Lecanora helva]
MPRVTRAVLRSQEIHEDAASVPLPLTPIKGRTPLGETAGNASVIPEMIDTGEGTMTGTEKGPGKGKKGKASKNATKKKKANKEEPMVEVLEDDNQSQTSSAAEEASKDLIEGSIADTNPESVAMDDGQLGTPASAAADQASKHLSSEPTITLPEMDKSQSYETTKVEEPLIVSAESDSVTNAPSEEGLGIAVANNNEEDDSFVEKIKSRTPAKRVSRIEDSVEALDALEEEIEKIGVLVPGPNEVQSPVKNTKQAKSPIKAGNNDIKGSLRIKKGAATTGQADGRKPTVSVRSVGSRPSIAPATAKKVTTSTKSTTNSKGDKITKKPTATPAVAPQSSKKPHQRISSIHKAPFQIEKSTKPPTRSTFELPGEAFSRKMKEQREERMKKEEEEKSKPRAAKPRPVRRSEAPDVKLTAAVKARLSLAKGENVNPSTVKRDTVDSAKSKTKADASKTKAPYLAPVPKQPAKGPNKRLSSLTVAKRDSKPVPPPTTTTKSSTQPPRLSLPATRNPSASAAPPTASDLAKQSVKGKEIFGRHKTEIQERENARKEKEAAAKKARVEAAERGRAASRAWAEGQRAKKVEKNKVVGGEVKG